MVKTKGLSIAIWAVFVLLAFAVTIIGISLGLTNLYKNEYETTDGQKLEDCKVLSCKDNTLLNRKF